MKRQRSCEGAETHAYCKLNDCTATQECSPGLTWTCFLANNQYFMTVTSED